jgi:hypothetical protein
MVLFLSVESMRSLLRPNVNPKQFGPLKGVLAINPNEVVPEIGTLLKFGFLFEEEGDAYIAFWPENQKAVIEQLQKKGISFTDKDPTHQLLN